MSNLATWPQSARALLEARYKAFVSGDIDFLIESHHPELRSQLNRDAIQSWSAESKWSGLEIEDEKVADDKTFITFTVKYERNFDRINHREYAEFRKEGDKWYYYDSEFPKPEPVKVDKVGRNDPCTCGSGKKYKKCCGLAA